MRNKLNVLLLTLLIISSTDLSAFAQSNSNPPQLPGTCKNGRYVGCTAFNESGFWVTVYTGFREVKCEERQGMATIDATRKCVQSAARINRKFFPYNQWASPCIFTDKLGINDELGWTVAAYGYVEGYTCDA